jgi:RNA polymerase II C-terminal domain phosphatase-like 1/2
MDVCTCRLENAYLEDGSLVQRPVIRLQQGLIILTRIDPLNPKTSMLLRVRPGWNELRAFLAGEVDGKQRCDKELLG